MTRFKKFFSYTFDISDAEKIIREYYAITRDIPHDERELTRRSRSAHRATSAQSFRQKVRKDFHEAVQQMIDSYTEKGIIQRPDYAEFEARARQRFKI